MDSQVLIVVTSKMCHWPFGHDIVVTRRMSPAIHGQLPVHPDGASHHKLYLVSQSSVPE